MTRLVIVAIVVVMGTSHDAQWLKQPTPGNPRQADDKQRLEDLELMETFDDSKIDARPWTIGIDVDVVTDTEMIVNVTLSGDTLFMDAAGKDKQEMIPLSETTFALPGGRLDFVGNDQGAVTHLVFHAVEGDMKAVRKTP